MSPGSKDARDHDAGDYRSRRERESRRPLDSSSPLASLIRSYTLIVCLFAVFFSLSLSFHSDCLLVIRVSLSSFRDFHLSVSHSRLSIESAVCEEEQGDCDGKTEEWVLLV